MPITTLPIDIREVNYSDLPQLHRLSVATFNDTFNSQSFSNFSDYTQTNYNYGQLASEMINPNSFFYFIFFNHKLAGYLKLNIDDAQSQSVAGGLEIDRIYLREGFKYMGLEEKLINLAFEKAKKFHKDTIWSSVWEHNAPIMYYYKEFGFKAFGSQEFKLEDTIQKDLIMKVHF
ncbi:GNAT family N-acetyltransferase [Companilactobacillus halodurans]|uniref:GNAT family N-acetyltransferase n=1 Tax=Companilactobacillus halodurans TaxID=2584183 RepID=A0A5P0ZYH0_9LACO|nr:GNAT family N-acetyltransferase [Companilactobacillus halodurans]MQS76685.1 GNAT family N-acetyltransferase [Companilactobacillus halodurans]MQS97838.1 GNAT family N-acetyltransferase [Companilactobacillus halodurans]